MPARLSAGLFLVFALVALGQALPASGQHCRPGLQRLRPPWAEGESGAGGPSLPRGWGA